jgi:poly-D-alanine transfer protein DltD
MSNEDEIKEIVKKLERKTNLKAYEKKFLEVYNKRTCDEDLIRELQLAGKDRYIERNTKADFKQANKNFRDELKKQGKSLEGNWTEAPPPPPAIPEDCCIM